MNKTVKKHIDGEEGSFLTKARCEFKWDWEVFEIQSIKIYLYEPWYKQL